MAKISLMVQALYQRGGGGGGVRIGQEIPLVFEGLLSLMVVSIAGQSECPLEPSRPPPIDSVVLQGLGIWKLV